MKVVILSKTFTKGGAASGARNLRSALAAAQAEIISFDSECASVSIFVKMKRIFERAFERILFGPEVHCIRLFQETFSLKEIYKIHQPDIIQLCDVSGNIVDLSEFSQVPCPIVHRMSDFWPYHGPSHYQLKPFNSNALANWFFSRLIKLPDLNCVFRVVPSEWLGQALQDADDSRMAFIPNSVQLASDNARVKVVKHGCITLGFISKPVLDPRKGFLKLLVFIDRLKLKKIGLKLLVFGDIKNNKKIYSQRVTIEYKDAFSREEVSRVYNSLDILVCPSVFDNSPNVVTEALAHGCLVIGNKGTGMDSYIYPEFGLLFNFWNENQDTSQFEFFLNQAYKNYSEMSASAISYVANNLTPEIIGNRYCQLYNKIINDGKEIIDA